MLIKYIGRIRGQVDVPVLKHLVTPGEPFEVDEDLGKSLLEQPSNWAKVRKQKKKTTPAVEELPEETLDEETEE